MVALLERLLFAHRRVVMGLFLVTTLGLGTAATHLRLDSGFLKLVPLDHPYIKTFLEFRSLAASANRISVALVAKQGDIYQPDFFRTLRAATDELAAIPGIDRGSVTSLFTPNTTYVEVVNSGFAQKRVVPASFEPTPEGLASVRNAVAQASLVGRLVSTDQRGAMLSADLVEVDPATGKRLDYAELGKALEQRIRARFAAQGVEVHIIGFAKVIADIIEGLKYVLLFMLVTLGVALTLLWLSGRSLLSALLPILSSAAAVVWQLGLLTLLGFGIDPMSVLICFLIFVIGISHGVQMVNAVRLGLAAGHDSLAAGREGFRTLLLPASLANATDFVGFAALLFVKIGVLREIAISAILGESAVLVIVVVLLPVVLSFVATPRSLPSRVESSQPSEAAVGGALVSLLSRFAERRWAWRSLAVSAVLGVLFLWVGEPEVGDLQPGAPEFHPRSRYNRDVAAISERFSLGADVLAVIAQGAPDACLDPRAMRLVDQLHGRMERVDGVQGVIDAVHIAKLAFTKWNDENPRWYGVPGSPQALALAVGSVEPSTGLINDNCSLMTMAIFTRDHTAPTIRAVMGELKQFAAGMAPNAPLKLRLASGNVGIMAATNEVIEQGQLPMKLAVFGSIMVLVLLWFRSWRAVVVIVAPLALVAVGANALMSCLKIGLTISTMPVMALGAGIGVDFSIYIYGRLAKLSKAGLALPEAYRHAIAAAGTPVLVTSLTLATGIGVWAFSPLKFQADLGLMLAVVLVANMLGALVLLPALASLVFPTTPARAALVK